MNHAAIFLACRAVVHHGGAGTTAAVLRAGVPTLILWLLGDQPIWGATVKRLRVGTARRFPSTTRESLVADLRTILAAEYVARAREFATRMTKPAEASRPPLIWWKTSRAQGVVQHRPPERRASSAFIDGVCGAIRAIRLTEGSVHGR